MNRLKLMFIDDIKCLFINDIFFPSRLLPVILGLILPVFIAGCGSYNKDTAGTISGMRLQKHLAYNPRFIFDMPGKTSRGHYISSEQFGRIPWPVSPETYHYITSGETITYHEELISDEYLAGDQKPRNRYHRRLYGRRVGQIIR